MGRRSRRRMAQIMGEGQGGQAGEEQASRPASQPGKKDNTKMYLGLGVAGIIVVLGIAFLVSNAFANGGGAQPSGNLAGSGQQQAVNQQAGTQGSGDAQVVRITVTSRGYQMSQQTVDAGRPVRLIIDGSQAPGCYSYIMSRSLGFSRQLGDTPEVVDLPALQPGSYGFSCGMGMIRGSLNVR